MQQIEYKVFYIPKRSGGTRKIEQPLGKGMEILQDKLEEIEKIKELKPSYFAHSFMHGRNIVTCARQHFGNKYIARIDIKDFFNSITLESFRNVVFRYYRGMKEYKNEFKNADKIMNNIKICFKYDKKRKVHYLPQGAPTSPFLSNSYMRGFDWEMAWFCYKNKVIYSRYADDIYISSNNKDNKFWSCLKCIINSLTYIHLIENKRKRRVMKQGTRMNVVGIVLNEKFQIPKKTRKIIRAILHNASKDGVELNSEQKGLINFKNMVETYKSDVESNLEVCKGLEVIKAI